MTNTSPIQTDFSGGEVDSFLIGRTDSEEYKKVVKTMTNFNADRRGPAERRDGHQFLFSYNQEETNIFEFKTSRNEVLSIIISVTNVYVVDMTGAIKATYASPWSAAQIPDIQMEIAPDFNTMYLVHRKVPHQRLDIVFAASFYSSSTFAPVVYTFGAGSSPWGTDYPGAIMFFQGRMWLGGTDLLPTGVWGSKPGLYDNFDFGAGSLATDALAFTMTKQGDIKWLQGYKTFFAGLDTGEESITSIGNVIAFDDASLNPESANGSALIPSLLIKNYINYVMPDKQTIQSLRYNFNVNGHESKELNLASRHLTAGLIKNWTFRKYPIPSIICTLESGEIIQGNMKPDGKFGWSRHTTDGTYVSSAVMYEGVVTSRWTAVNRNGLTCIEKESRNAFMDSFVYKNNGVGVDSNIIIAIPHLSNKTVQVIAKRSTDPVDSPFSQIPDIVLDSTGAGTLPYAVNEYYIGLKYISTLVTMPQTNQDKLKSIDNDNKRFSEIYTRVISSVIPKINGNRPNTSKHSDPIGTRSLDRTVTLTGMSSGWDTDASITIEQDLPFDTIIVNIGGEMEVNKI